MRYVSSLIIQEIIVKKSVFKYRPICLALAVTGFFSSCVYAEVSNQPETPHAVAENSALSFDIDGYVIDGSKVFSQAEIDAATKPYIGRGKNFSNVQQALAAVETAYAARGFSAIQVTLPEQKLKNGIVHFQILEIHYGKITVQDNQFFSAENILKSLPTLRNGNMPKSPQLTRELKLANENPAKQAEVVLKQGDKANEVDAIVHIKDSKASQFIITADNTGSPETGRSRLGLSYRNANLFNADHVANLQLLMSPEKPDRVQVVGGGYKIPLYQYGDSVEFFAGYSNVNSVVGGLANFKGGGLLLSGRYNHTLERAGAFEQKISAGLDWRDFKRVEQTLPAPILLYNEIVVVPASLSYAAEGKFDSSNLNLNTSLSVNIPGMNKGSAQDFAAYDPSRTLKPKANYSVLRYGVAYNCSVMNDWQVKATLNGQQSNDILILGEQFRLGGADGVRGFSEGSESGNSGTRVSLEGYTPNLGSNNMMARGLLFIDSGQVQATAISPKSSITAAGIGLRSSLAEHFNLRLDMAKILNAGVDTLQRVGDWRAHLTVMAYF